MVNFIFTADVEIVSAGNFMNSQKIPLRTPFLFSDPNIIEPRTIDSFRQKAEIIIEFKNIFESIFLPFIISW